VCHGRSYLATLLDGVGVGAVFVGKISLKNLRRVAKEIGENMTDEELQEMIDEADRDGDGEINEEEYVTLCRAFC